VPLAGKTGTVNDNTDVWFIGYTPTYVTGVWVGYPGRKKSLGRDMTGSRGALPLFVDFMRDFLKDRPREEFNKLPRMPEGIEALQQMRQRQMAAEREAREALAALSSGAEVAAPLPELPELELEEIRLPAPADAGGLYGPARDAESGRGRVTTRSATMPRVRTDMGQPPLPAPDDTPVRFPQKLGKKGDGGSRGGAQDQAELPSGRRKSTGQKKAVSENTHEGAHGP
jgi:membrane peptidoglycan carboxypeptidase